MRTITYTHRSIDDASRVFKEIWAIDSDLIVEIGHDILDRNKADKLISFVTDKVEKLQIGSFRIGESEIRIQRKKTVSSPRTAVLMRTKDAILIPLEPLRRKIFMDFYDKLPQFSSEKSVFWMIDGKRWKYHEDDFRSVVYGTTVTDLTVGLHHYKGFEDIYEVYLKNIELFNNTGLVPSFTYPNKDGLFFLKDARCLNGILLKSYGRMRFLLNPFAEPQLDITIVRKLRELFP